MRGKDVEQRAKKRVGGITPAHAGKSYLDWGESGGVGDHPRACGEKVEKAIRRHFD